jgi:hypothetical protein
MLNRSQLALDQFGTIISTIHYSFIDRTVLTCTVVHLQLPQTYLLQIIYSYCIRIIPLKYHNAGQDFREIGFREIVG